VGIGHRPERARAEPAIVQVLGEGRGHLCELERVTEIDAQLRARLFQQLLDGLP
jgi:hypothetical protein